ncbi:chromate transporter [Stenotrophomonas sp. ISL-67]|uniref:chromate transporter n=1 Tax=Stenotrophomonas sp. ISL-67 TaxID=2819171 RepID=UPI00203606D4|nr:chromate transporter [Stenotrophomonas sp. ISL-67]
MERRRRCLGRCSHWLPFSAPKCRWGCLLSSVPWSRWSRCFCLVLLLAVLPFWAQVCRHRLATSAMAGVNAAVVGLLAAAFYDPVLTAGLDGPMDAAIAAVGFALLAFARLPSLWIVLWCVATSIAWRLPG